MTPLLRYLIGIALGTTLGFLIPHNVILLDTIEQIRVIVLSLGRYLLLPLIFFSLPVAVTQLRRLKSLGKLLGISALITLISSAVLTITGTVLTWLIGIDRIPVVPGVPLERETFNLVVFLKNILLFDNFASLGVEGNSLIPLILPAFLLGWHFFYDREVAEPAFNVFDSLCRILYRANSYILILMPFFLAALSFSTSYAMRHVVDIQNFIPLTTMLTGISAVLLIIVYPFVLKWVAKVPSPWKTFGHFSGVLLGGFCSGSPMFNYGNLTFHLNEKLKIPRHTAALSAPFYLMFVRGGTAMVSAICMMTVIRSYSNLELTLFQAAWITLFSFLISLTLPSMPDSGLTMSLAMLSTFYGRGLNNGWLILVPFLPILIMFSALLDSATAALLIIISHRHTFPPEEE